MPLAGHGLQLTHNNCGDPVTAHIPDQEMRCNKGRSRPHGEEWLDFDRSCFLPAALAPEPYALFLAGYDIIKE